MALPSVSTVAWDGHGMDVAFAEAAALGFDRVEPAFIRGYVDFGEDAFSDIRAVRMRAALASHGLTAQALSAHIDLTGSQAEAELARRIGFAAGIGAPVLITNAGPRAGQDVALRSIGACMDRLDDAGVTLALENPGHGSGDMFATAADGVALARRIGAPRVGLNYDFGNIWTYSGGAVAPQTDFSDARAQTVHAHLKDIRTDGADWRFCALGQGAVDYAAVAPLLGAIPAGLELPLRLSRPRRGDPLRDAAPLPLAAIRAAVAASRDCWCGLTD